MGDDNIQYVTTDMCWFNNMFLRSSRQQGAVKLQCLFVCYLVKMKIQITSNNYVLIYGGPNLTEYLAIPLPGNDV